LHSARPFAAQHGDVYWVVRLPALERMSNSMKARGSDEGRGLDEAESALREELVKACKVLYAVKAAGDGWVVI